ncbi:macrolide family glycosyltransferase [Frankia sp. AgB32]|uniref:macrolide family glycosyltransferase n=1 Tax=Frankia sp. AgB32 TaxID=631119 RepID=UPI00200FB9B4|nr:macrolide family glycosyltransferase [Frankia sp. AgB32]
MPTARHIAMIGCTTPSHVHPSLGVIAELVRRGHRVGYAIGDRLAGLVAPTGVEPVTFASTLPAEDDEWPDNPIAELDTHMFLNEGIASLPRLLDHFTADPPDLVIHDIAALAGPVLGARLGVPTVLLSPTWMPWEGFEAENAPMLRPPRTSPAGLGYHAAYGDWLRGQGIDRDAWEWMTAAVPAVCLIPSVLQPQLHRVRPTVRFVGPCLDPARLAAQSWAPPPNRRRVLLISLGTVFNDRPDIYRAAAAAFAETDWHVVMAVGRRVDPAGLGPLPVNVEAHRSVPQLGVLARASAFVTHAGMGSCVEAAWFGVPTVAIPLAAEQFGNAAILSALGISRQLLAQQVDPRLLRAEVEAVATSPHIAQRLALVRAALRSQGGIADAADAVAAHLP